MVKNRKEYTTTEVDAGSNLLTIEYRYKNAWNSTVEQINLFNEDVTIYREAEKDFAPGDKILFTRNDKQLGVQNGLSGTIEKSTGTRTSLCG